jgi:phage tail-like protein
MPPPRTTRYGGHQILVEIDGKAIGGFAEISGLASERTLPARRRANSPRGPARGPAGPTAGDITLRRGVVDSAYLRQWLALARGAGVTARRTVVITLLDEARRSVQAWNLLGVIPRKYTGPTLAGRGGGDVAMEELVLSAEGVELQGPTP